VAADAPAARQGSTLSGLCGVVTEVIGSAVAVRFTFGGFDPGRAQPPGYAHTLAEAELAKLHDPNSPSRPSRSPNVPSSNSPHQGGDGAPLASAERCLGTYDAGHRAAAKLGGHGLGGGVSANEWAAAKDAHERAALRGAVQALLVPRADARGAGQSPPLAEEDDELELRPFRGAVAGAAGGAAAGSAAWCERVTLGICAPDAAAGVAALKR
jgi:hypothetical protein